MTRTRVASAAAAMSLLWIVAASAAAEPAPDAHHATAEHHAAAEHNAGAEHAHVASLRDLLFPAINFAIYLVIIVRFVIPAMRDYVSRRRSEAVEAASLASQSLAQAERLVATNKQRLARLPTEADEIRRDLVAIATRQGERLVAEAQQGGVRRVNDAKLMGEHERRRALEAIRSETATTAVTVAEQKIRTALTSTDQRAFVEQFLKDAAAR
jgi:F-type H+-transporting ATPase subunit b